MVCELCGDNKNIGKQAGYFNKHLVEKHSIKNYETYILITKYNNIKPKCLCGCGNETNFINNDFKKYCHGHNSQHMFNLKRDLILENKIINDYKNYLSVKDIVDKYELNRNTIYRILKQNNITRTVSKSKQLYVINEKIFEVIDNEEKAYWLGFLFADGYNNTNKNDVRLCISNVDYCHLIKFTEFLNTNKPIRYNNKNSSSVVIENKKISKDLASKGMVKCKTFILEYPNINRQLDKHFIRGFFDGDGCITYGKKFNILANISMVSTGIFLNEITKRIPINFSYTKRHKFKDDNILTISSGGICNLLKFYDYIYKDSTIYLKRKHDKFVNWFEFYFNRTRIQNKTLKLKNKINYGK